MNRSLPASTAILGVLSIAACASHAQPVPTAPANQEAGSTVDASAQNIDASAQSIDAGAQNSSVPTIAMPRISAGVPAFASGSSNPFTGPKNANDNDPTTSWVPDALPAWIAYDLSAAPDAQRHSILVVWNAPHAGSYLNKTPPMSAPTNYTIEVNTAPGGTSAPPSTGWVQVSAVSNNLRNTVEHPVDLGGGNWVRMSIAPGVDPSPAIDLDVFSTPNGNTDCWLFMGDSITYITMGYAFSNLPALVHQARPDRWPAVINAAIGGTNTTTAAAAIDETMSGFPGRYVVLAYGTNDQPNEFNMEPLVQKVIAAAKIPVVPHMPWAAGQNIQTNAPPNNKAIDDLYAKYPQIVHGPDLWAAFMNRTDLIPANDIHPNGAGQAFLRQQWAAVMAAIP